MTIEVGIVEHFTAEHQLRGDFGPASVPHAHDYRIDVQVSGPSLQADGTLLDITVLQASLDHVLRPLRDRDLNPILEPSVGNPTAEALAQFIFAGVAPALHGRGLTRLRVSVWESSSAYAAWSGVLA